MIKKKVNRELLEKKRQAYLKVRGQHAVKLSRRYRKTSKSRVKEQQSIYQQEKRTGASQKRLAEVKEDLKQAKETYRTSKVLEKEQLKRVGGSRKAKLARKSYQQTRMLGEATWADNDVLEDVVSSRQKIRQAKYSVRQSQVVARHAKTLGKGTIKGTYHVGNRGYNFVRGRGFIRTAKADRWETKLQGRLNRLRLRYRQSKLGKVTYTTKRTVIRVVKWIPNPLTVKGYLISFILLTFFAIVMGIFAGSGPVQQDEFDLNQSWLQVSRRDREKSTDKVDYWTNIDDILFYMNFRYGSSWKPSDPWEEGFGGKLSATLGFNRYSDALNDIWNNLNKDSNNLKSMVDLYGESSQVKWLKLDKDDLEEFKEQEELAREIGRYPAYTELSNPFYSDEDEKSKESLLILKRFGYVSKDEIYNGSVFKASKGQELRAMMSGKVKVTDKDVMISTDDARLTYKNVSGIRVKSGEMLADGDIVGTVSSDNGQEVYYHKLEEKGTKKQKAKWTYVNIGFYLPEVTYNQTSSVLSDMDFSGDVASRVNAAKDYIKKFEPKATDNGLSSMFGNFLTESNMTAKRAEGDYLAPPVGATASSWDDEAWLAIGEPAIYNGRYPNILRRGLGLGQWTDTADGSIRHTMLLAYAKEKGKKWYDLELQLDFIFNGDTPYYREIARKILTSNEDVDTLTKRFLNLWEGNAGDKLLERQNNARQVLQYLKHGGGRKGGFSPLKDSGQPLSVPYTVTQLFGANANNGIYDGAGHTGMDLAAPQGSPVYAVSDGKVVIVNGGYENINGNHVVHSLPDGSYIYYGHMRDYPLVKVGDTVKKGQQIGVVGQTGLATGPHVHFERRQTPQWGNFLDPSSLLFQTPPFPGQVVIPK